MNDSLLCARKRHLNFFFFIFSMRESFERKRPLKKKETLWSTRRFLLFMPDAAWRKSTVRHIHMPQKRQIEARMNFTEKKKWKCFVSCFVTSILDNWRCCFENRKLNLCFDEGEEGGGWFSERIERFLEIKFYHRLKVYF